MTGSHSGDHSALLNEALVIYLGGEPETQGARPPWSAERLEKVYLSNGKLLYDEILPIVSFMDSLVIDWSKETLQTASETAKKLAKAEFPWLSDVAIEKLASYFAYQWK